MVTRKLGRIAAILLLLQFAGCGQFQAIFDPAVTPRGSERVEKGRSVHRKPAKLKLGGAPDKAAQGEGEVRDPIVTRQGVYYYVRPGDTLSRIASRYNAEWEQIAQINDLYDGELVVGRRIFIPHKKNIENYLVVAKVITEDRTPAWRTGKAQFAWPIEDARITSVFGHRRGRPHDGVDIGAKVGTPVLAAEEGRVIFAERFAGYGNLVVIKHPGDYFTAYAHNSQVYVRKGQRVKKGQNISLVGMTGRTTGPHLHFEMRLRTQAVDPLSLLPRKN